MNFSGLGNLGGESTIKLKPGATTRHVPIQTGAGQNGSPGCDFQSRGAHPLVCRDGGDPKEKWNCQDMRGLKMSQH